MTVAEERMTWEIKIYFHSSLLREVGKKYNNTFPSQYTFEKKKLVVFVVFVYFSCIERSGNNQWHGLSPLHELKRF
jgi:hypothetical protein